MTLAESNDVSGQERYFDPDIELAERSRLRSIQERLLQQSIEFTLERSAFAKDLWSRAGVDPRKISSIEDFTEKAPAFFQRDVTNWAADHKDSYGGMLCLDKRHVTFIASTSGTTGIPMALPQYEGNPRAIASSRDMWEEGLAPGETTMRLNIISRGALVPATHEVVEKLGLRTVCLVNNPGVAADLIEASRRFRPVSFSLISRPVMIALQDYAEAHNVDLREVFASYRCVTFGGEPLGADGRKVLESWFGRVRIHTGLGNTVAAVECLAGNGGHTWEDLVLVEVRDPETFEPLAEGEVGELVVTTLQERGTPLLRFRNEDLVRWTSEPCSCGRTHGRIWTLGRRGDGVRIRGKLVLPSSLLPVFAPFPETRDELFQIVIADNGQDELRVRVGRGEGRSDSELRQALESEISAQLGLPASVELQSKAKLMSSGPGYKIPRIVRA